MAPLRLPFGYPSASLRDQLRDQLRVRITGASKYIFHYFYRPDARLF